MSRVVRSIRINRYSLKFNWVADKIKVSIPNHVEEIDTNNFHFSDNLKKRLITLKPEIIEKLEKFILDCYHSEPEFIMFELSKGGDITPVK